MTIIKSGSCGEGDGNRIGEQSSPAKKNPNLGKINDLRFIDRHIAAPRTALNTGYGTPAALIEGPPLPKIQTVFQTLLGLLVRSMPSPDSGRVSANLPAELRSAAYPALWFLTRDSERGLN